MTVLVTVVANGWGSKLKDEETGEITLHYLKCGPGSGLTGPGSKTILCGTWLADSNPSNMSRKVPNPLATAGKFTHQKWIPEYLAAKLSLYPKGADEGDLDTFLATERASNNNEGSSDDEGSSDEGSESAAGSSKFGSKSCGQGRFKRQKQWASCLQHPPHRRKSCCPLERGGCSKSFCVCSYKQMTRSTKIIYTS
jgi:hypothetical protein